MDKHISIYIYICIYRIHRYFSMSPLNLKVSPHTGRFVCVNPPKRPLYRQAQPTWTWTARRNSQSPHPFEGKQQAGYFKTSVLAMIKYIKFEPQTDHARFSTGKSKGGCLHIGLIKHAFPEDLSNFMQGCMLPVLRLFALQVMSVPSTDREGAQKFQFQSGASGTKQVFNGGLSVFGPPKRSDSFWFPL